MAPLLAIIADDLTGALDSAAPFAARGLRVSVALAPAHVAEALASAPDVLSVTTRSREASPEAAARAVRQAIAPLAGIRLFKKIDSRLKGNIEAELAALPPQDLLVVPALPSFGRLVRGGRLHGFGVAEPVDIRQRLGALAARARVPDVESEADLARALALPGLAVGARGLAAALARRMVPDRPDLFLSALPGPRGLFVIGSTDPITLAQVAALRAAEGVTHVDAPNGRVSGLADARFLVVQATPGAQIVAGDQVAQALAAGVAPLLRPGFGTVLLTGGATAEAVVHQLGLPTLRLIGECLPGIAVTQGAGLTFVTKSGGFGARDCLRRVVALIGTDRA